MAIIRLVRHGEASAGWDGDLDPGLSELGRRQAEDVARWLASDESVRLITSPLRRARETAAPLAARWGVDADVDDAVGEIVAPAGVVGLRERSTWLRQAMKGTWSDLGDEHHAWRSLVVERIRLLPVDAVVFTHFIAINVAVGEATGDDRVVCFAPGNASVTRIRNDDGVLVVDALGEQAATQVL